MRKYFSFLILSLVMTLSACTEQSLPVFENPQPISVPSGKPAYGPRLAKGHDDKLVLSWMERNDEGISLRFSPYDQGTWRPAVVAVKDDAMFVNWADLPAVTPVTSGKLLAHWLSYVADATYAYQVLTAFSDDGGASWSRPVSPHTDGTPTEHGFVSTYAADDGTGLVWLDGRDTPGAAMTLRTATLASDGGLSDETVLDDSVCDCCQTDVAIAQSGPVAIYRNRTEDEIRDIYVARQLDGTWQPGIAVSTDGWEISGCPVNGPVIEANGKLVVAAWFTAANNEPAVKVAVSKNSGKSFSVPLNVAGKNVLGHVSLTFIGNQTYAVSWMESGKNEDYVIKLRAFTVDGQSGRVQTVGLTSVARNVPQMVLVDDKLILAWTDTMEDLSKVVSVKVQIRGFYN
jgi:hypothetical protein